MNTDAIKLRAWEYSDVPLLAKYANNKNVSINLTDSFPFPYTEEDGKRFVSRIREKEDIPVFLIEYNGEFAGGIGLHQKNDIYRICYVLGYWVIEPLWGKGIVTEAIRQIVIKGFERPDLERIEAGTFEWNKASARVLEKNGFILESIIKKGAIKDGKIIDLYNYRMLRDEALDLGLIKK